MRQQESVREARGNRMEVSEAGWTEQQLRRWRAAGLIDEATARRILDFEAGEQAVQPPAGSQRPGLLEALLYLGLAVTAVGIVVLAAQHWQDLRSWARIATLAVPCLLALAVGLALRGATQPEARRAAGMAWLADVALLAGTVAVGGNEAGWTGDDTALAAGAVATLLALLLWAVHPAHPQIIAIAGSLVLLAEATGARPAGHSNEIAGGLLMVFAIAGLVLTETGLLGPRVSARAASAAGLVFGAFDAGYFVTSRSSEPAWVQLLMLVAGIVLVALSLRRASFIFMLIGIIGVFGGLVAFILSNFEAQIGAPAALIVSGALLVAAGLLLARARAWFHAGSAA